MRPAGGGSPSPKPFPFSFTGRTPRIISSSCRDGVPCTRMSGHTDEHSSGDSLVKISEKGEGALGPPSPKLFAQSLTFLPHLGHQEAFAGMLSPQWGQGAVSVVTSTVPSA